MSTYVICYRFYSKAVQCRLFAINCDYVTGRSKLRMIQHETFIFFSSELSINGNIEDIAAYNWPKCDTYYLISTMYHIQVDHYNLIL